MKNSLVRFNKSNVLVFCFSVFILLSATTILYFYESFLNSELKALENHQSIAFQKISTISDSEKVFVTGFNSIYSKDITIRDDVVRLIELGEELQELRQSALEQLDSNFVQRYPDRVQEVIELNNRKDALIFSITGLVLFFNSSEYYYPDTVYWDEWHDLSTGYWEFSTKYLNFIKSEMIKVADKMIVINDFHRFLVYIILITNAIMFYYVLRYLVIPLNQASKLIQSGDVYKLSKIDTMFYDVRALFVKLISYEKESNRTIMELEKASQDKTNFLNTMSHELRTPLNVMIGTVSLMKSESGGDLRHIENIEAVSNNLLEIIDNVLILSKLEKISETKIVSIIELSEFIEMTVNGLIIGKDISFEMYFSPDFPQNFETHELKLKQAIVNIISNAIKAVKDKGVVRLRLMCRGNTLKFSVFDNGIGIDKKSIPRLLMPFEQAEYAVENGTSGLGLYLVALTAKSLGGHVNVTSQLGKGTRVCLTINVDNKHSQIEKLQFDGLINLCTTPSYVKKSLAHLRREVFNQEHIAMPGVYNMLSFHMSEDSTAEQPESQTKLNMRILVAEDYALNASIVKKLAKNLDVGAVIAVDGEQVVDIYKHDRNFDLIIMDIQMPILNGFEASTKVREFDKTIPILASSAFLESEIEKKFEDCGINGFLQKPYTLQQLATAIQTYTKQKI